MDLIDREKALGCFWAYEDGDETEMPAYDRLQALPIVAEVEDCISRQAAIDELKKYIAVNRNSNHDARIWEEGMNCAVTVIGALPSAQPETEERTAESAQNVPNDELVSKKVAIDALWKALYEYEDKTEKQFQESEDLDVGDWIEHRIFVQNMNDIDRQTILNLPSAQPTLYGYNIAHLEMIARVLQKEDLSPERVAEALTDIGRIVAIVKDEFEETLRKAVEQCVTLSTDRMQ